MVESATTGARSNLRQVSDGSSRRARGDGRLECELAARFEHVKKRSIRRDQLQGLTALTRWAIIAYKREGVTVRRSFRQIVRAIGPDLGWHAGTVRETRQRYRTALARRLDALVELGIVEHWEPELAANGEGRGILVVLSAVVAQLARAPLS